MMGLSLAQASIFSTGSTSTEVAPALFSSSRVSHRRRLRARQQLCNGGQRRSGSMQHDVLAAFDLFHAVDAHQQAPGPFALLRGDRHRRADQRGLAVEHRLGLAQMIGRQRGSGRHQIANQIRAAQPRRDFHGAAQQDHLGADAVIGQKTRQDVRISRRNAHALQ